MISAENVINEVDLKIKNLNDRKKVIVKLIADRDKREHLNNEINEAVSGLSGVKNSPALIELLEELNTGNVKDKQCATCKKESA